jgi:ketosteroid isomerase-like protein
MLMRRINHCLLAVSLLVASPLAGQDDPVIAELDAFWAEVARTVAEGDFEGMVATYHPDGVWVSAVPSRPATRALRGMTAEAAEVAARTRAGEQAPRVEFRFSSRVHDSTTAHEVGMVRFTSTRGGVVVEDVYGLVDSYLVKKDGRWMILVEIQRWDMTKAEWDALR